jgi:hypothetical protein
MSDRWVFLAAFSTVVLIVAGAFAMPQFFGYELIKSCIFVAIAVLVFFGEDKFSYMLGVLAPLLWFILDLLLGDLLGDLKLMLGWVIGRRVAPLDTPLHGFSIVMAVILLILSARAWKRQVPERFFGKTFVICLAISLAYIAVLAGWQLRMINTGIRPH